MNQSLPMSFSSPKYDEDDIQVGSIFDTLWHSRWLILKITFSVILIGVIYAFAATPIYEATMLIHVEEESQKESKNLLGEMATIFDVKAAASSEMELLHSRLVVSRAIDNLRLYIHTRPKYFPVIGRYLAQKNEQLSNPGIFGYGGYVWGNESVDILAFNVPEAMLNKVFTLTVENDNDFRITQEDLHISAKGSVGKPLQIETGKDTIELYILEISAKPGAQFSLTRMTRLSAIEKIQKSMVITEQTKQSGIINIKLQGEDAQLTSKVLNEIGAEYMRQNLARKLEEAEKSLAFLDKQLPELKQTMEKSEDQYNQFRNTHGMVDITEEAKLSLQQSVAAKSRRIDLLQKRTELLTRFTPNHPSIIAIDNQLNQITSELKALSDYVKTVPNLEQESLRLNREVKLNTDLYTALLNTAQHLRLITLGKVSNVRLVDTSLVPERPVTPNRPKIIGASTLAGIFLGMMTAFLRQAFNKGIQNPYEIEKLLGMPVYAVIPHSKMQKELLEKIGNKNSRQPLLAKISSNDIAIESLRSFRAAMQFSMSHSRNNIVMITGPTPGVGKSFVTVNLAAIIAATGKKVLLVDADLRHGYLHNYFDLANQTGLSDVIRGKSLLEQTIHKEVVENIDFISKGSFTDNPSELLLHPRFNELLHSISEQYGVILIDVAPVLSVSDALIIGQHTGAIYLITRAEVSTTGEISESLKLLSQAGLTVKGILFNDLKSKPGRYGDKYARYRESQVPALSMQ